MNRREDQPLDLSSIDPTVDQTRFDEIVGAIVLSASDELAARRARNDVIGEIARWYKPMLTAAAAAVAALTLFTVRAPPLPVPEEPLGIAEAIGIPSTLAMWVRGDATPTTVELYSLFSGP